MSAYDLAVFVLAGLAGCAVVACGRALRHRLVLRCVPELARVADPGLRVSILDETAIPKSSHLASALTFAVVVIGAWWSADFLTERGLPLALGFVFGCVMLAAYLPLSAWRRPDRVAAAVRHAMNSRRLASCPGCGWLSAAGETAKCPHCGEPTNTDDVERNAAGERRG